MTGAGLAAYCGAVIYEGNFHAVDAGVIYRSAQPGPAELARYNRDHGIKSVLNLRGAHPGEGWYDREVGASQGLGMAHFDYALSAKRFVTASQIADLLKIIRQAPKPLLVHCQSGSDRAGLVSALYRVAIAGDVPQAAGRELSLVFGHFPYLTSRSGAMDASFDAFVREQAHPKSR